MNDAAEKTLGLIRIDSFGTRLRGIQFELHAVPEDTVSTDRL